MFTVCSKCNLRLTVTATDLRAAQGYVRCGRCHNVFNALAALADDPARTTEQPAPAEPPERAPKPPQAAPEPAPPASSAPSQQEDPAATDSSLEFNPASTNINEVFIEAAPDEHTGNFESIVLVSEEPGEPERGAQPAIAPQALSAPAAPDESAARIDVETLRDALAEPRPVPAPAPVPEPPAPPQRIAPGDSERAAAPASEPQPPPQAAADPEPEREPEPVRAAAAQPAGVIEDVEFTFTDSSLEPLPASAGPPEVAVVAAAEITAALRVPATALAAPVTQPEPLLQPPAPRAGPPRWALAAGVVLLTLCLLAQVVHHYRNDLADTALLRGPLSALYADLGAPLEPHWDMGSYEVRQLGASSDGNAGNLVVRASISNRATRDQPLPLLRVVMQDRFGNRVAARDLKPAEYLARGAPPVSLLAPGQRIDVQVALQDPGQNATGFEIDACMNGHNHSIVCANDPGSH